MTDRCEPPPELRGVDGWHWVQQGNWPPRFAQWQVAPHGGRQPLWKNYELQHSCTPEWAATEWGWRYLSPVATPAEVEALRAERDEALKLQGEVHRLRTGIKLLADTVRAWGWQSKAQESNGELVGRALHEMDAANRALGTSRNTLRARVAELEGALAGMMELDAQASKIDEPPEADTIRERARAALSPATEG